MMKKTIFTLLALCLCTTTMWAVGYNQTEWADSDRDAATVYTDSQTGLSFYVLEGSAVLTYAEASSSNYSSLSSLTLPETVSDGTSTYTVTKVGDYAFDHASNIKGELVVPANILTLGRSAFENCTGITSVTIDYAETALANGNNQNWGTPFYSCSGITTVTLNRNLTQGRSVTSGYRTELFSDLTNIETVYIGENVTEIVHDLFNCNSSSSCNLATVYCYATTVPTLGSGVFDSHSGLTLHVYESLGDAYSDSDWATYFSTITNDIPDPEVEEGALKDVETGLYFDVDSEGVVSIIADKLGTYDNSNLVTCSEGYTLPEKVSADGVTYYDVTRIDDNAFDGATISGHLVIPAHITAMGISTFKNCTGLTEVTYEYSSTAVKEENEGSSSGAVNITFEGCSNIKTVNLNRNITLSSSTRHVGPFEYINGVTKVTIGENVTEIPNFLVRNTSTQCLSEVYCYPTTVPTTSFDPFGNITSCTLYVPAGCKDTYSSASYATRSYADANATTWGEFFTNIEEMGGESTPLADGEEFEVDGLNYVVVSSSEQTVKVTWAGSSNNSTYTGDVDIPENPVYENVTYTVVGIGENAFRNSSVTSVKMPSTVETIDNYAFASCSLSSITLPDKVNYIGQYAFYYCSSLESVNIPDEVLTLDGAAFQECSKLATVNITESCKMTTLGQYAFYNCKALKSFIVPAGVTSIEQYTFRDCTALETLTFASGSNLTSIGNYAARGCSSLKSLAIPAQVTTIGNQAFYQCSALETLTFDEDSELTTINMSAFYQCTSLTSVVIPNKVTTLGQGAFQGCSALEEVTLGESVSDMSADGIFSSCSKLLSVTSLNPEPPTCASTVFASATTSDGTLYVPCDSKDAYAEASTWSSFANIEGIDCEDEGGIPDGYTVDPAEGEVESLSVISLDTEGGLGESQYFYDETKKAEFKVVNDETGETVATLKEWEIMLDETTWHAWAEIRLSNEVSEAGSYTVTIPEGVFLDATDYNYDPNPAFTLHYTVTGAGASYEIVVDPESGSTVESLSEFTITCEDGLSLNSWDALEVKKDNVVVAHAWGDDPVWTDNGSVLGYIFTICDPDTEADLTLTDAGEYTIEVPEGYFLYDNESESEGFTITYTIEDNRLYTIEPEEGVVESLSSVKFIAIGNIAYAEVVEPEEIKVYKDGDTSSPVAYGVDINYAFKGIWDEYDEIVFNTELTDPGEYSVVIPEAFLALGDWFTYSEEMTLNYTIEKQLTFSDFYSLEPEEGVVESLSSVKFTPLEDAKIAWAEKVDVDQVKVYKDGDTSTAVAYGASVDHPYSGSYDEYDEIFFNVTLSDPGEYEVVFPYNSFVYNNNGRTSSEEFSLHYTIEESSWGVPSGYVLDPADESEVETLKTINISYDGAGLTCADAVYAGATGVVMSKTGGQVATVSFEDGWDDDLNLAYVIATLNEEISEMGTYYVTFPADVFMHWDDYGTNPEFTVTYYVTGPTSSTEYTFDPEDESTLTSLSEFTVYYSDGIDSSWNYNGEITVTDEDGNVVAHDDDCETEYPADDPWGDGLYCTITLDATITAAGKYTISIPEGYFIVGSNYLNSEALTITYYVDGSEAVEPGTFVCVVDPEDGSNNLEELAQVAFYNPTDGEEIFVNDELARDPEIYVYDEAGEVVTSISYFDTYFGNNWEEYAQIAVFEDAVKDGGTYTVSVPAEMFIIYDEDGRAYYSEAMTLTYTVVGSSTGIGGISINDENVEGIYSTSGQKLNSTQKGVNIIRYSDGSVKKLYVK